MGNTNIEPSNLSKAQIKELARHFSKLISFNPKENNLRECVEKLGGKIVFDNSKIGSIGGSITVNGRNNFTIYLSTITSKRRNNFTIAHELGHYVLHSMLGENKLEAKRDDSENSLAEIEANYFAAELLMPESNLKSEEQDDNVELAKIYDVSVPAMNWRRKLL